jgi:ABC-type nickel/cobalt efflux system permease component RcnA
VNDLDARLLDVFDSAALDQALWPVAIGIALLVGAAHALRPGHGKTLVAAYLVAEHGRWMHAAALAVIVAGLHTVSVLAIGLLWWAIAGDSVGSIEPVAVWGRFLVALMVLAVGAVVLRRQWRAFRRRRAGARERRVLEREHVRVGMGGAGSDMHAVSGVAAEERAQEHADLRPHVGWHDNAHDQDRWHEGDRVHGHDHHRRHDADLDHDHSHSHARDDDHNHELDYGHNHDHSHSHARDDDHNHELDYGHNHDHGHELDHGHSHGPPEGVAPWSWAGLFGIASAGALIPSPAAFLLLISGLLTGRAALAVVMVACFGIGLAGTVLAVGLTVIAGRDWLRRKASGRFARLGAVAPMLGAAAIVCGGFVLSVTALASLVGIG